MLFDNTIIINSEPEAVPSLYQQSIKTFVNDLNRTTKSGARIPQLRVVPVVVLCDILEEMTSYPALGRTLHRELSDPDLFMEMFMLNDATRSTLKKCLREASRIGKSVLPALAKNWCKALDEEKITLKTALAALELGAYLHEAGWPNESVEVLYIAFRIIPQEQTSMRISCVQKILRAEGSAFLRAKADETCSKLLKMIEDNTEDKIRLEVYLAVANHYFKSQRFVESDRWTCMASKFITKTTLAELKVEILQLTALKLFHSKRNEAADSVIRQAIYLARSTFGRNHRLYADTLYTYGVSLLKTSRCWDAIEIMLELLGIITALYGKCTPHVEYIQSYLAFGFNRLEASGRKGPKQTRVQGTIQLAEAIMHERGMASHFAAVRARILKGRNDFYDAMSFRIPNPSRTLDTNEEQQLMYDQCFFRKSTRNVKYS